MTVEPGDAQRLRLRDRRGRLTSAATLTALCWATAVLSVILAFSVRSPGGSGNPFRVHDVADALTTLGIVTGLLGTDLILVLIVLAARVPPVDRTFGPHRTIRMHRTLGTPALYLLLAHGVLLTLGYAIRGGITPFRETVDLFSVDLGLALAYVGLALIVAVVATSVVVVRRRMPYEVWFGVHLASYIAVAVALPHQLTAGGVLSRGSWQREYWVVLYVVALGAIVLYRFVMPVTVTLRHRIRVAGVDDLGGGLVSIRLEGRDLEQLGVRGGQYGVWRFWSRATWWHAHPVSFSALPGRTDARITVRTLGTGTTSLRALRVGTRVSLEGPYGTFTSRYRTAPRLAVFAAGIGVAPVRALLEDAHPGPGEATVVLRRSMVEPSSVEREIERLCRETDTGMRVLAGHRHPGSDAWWPGSSAGLRLVDLFPDLLDSDLFVCGPRAWTNLVAEDARAAGLPRHRLHVEDFGG